VGVSEHEQWIVDPSCGHCIYAFNGRTKNGDLRRVANPFLCCLFCNQGAPWEWWGYRRKPVLIGTIIVDAWVKDDEIMEGSDEGNDDP
jgi:hypothetical protein